MSRKKRIPRTSILIACEGKNTEPIYFGLIKEQIEEHNQFAITIYPDRDEENPKTAVIGLIEQAQSELNNYDEVWVVFDKNGYTLHKEAFELANKKINGKIIYLAFSSIAFEQWILLHFEKNITDFIKADCKDLNGKPLSCGSKTHVDDCNGVRCVAGYMRVKGYAKNYTKNSNNKNIYEILGEILRPQLLQNAFENSSWLRFLKKIENSSRSIYELNPYTNVDFLVKRLLGIEDIIEWCNLGDKMDFGKAFVTISSIGKDLKAIIFNQSNISLISVQFTFSFIDSAMNETAYSITRQIINPNEELALPLSHLPKGLIFIKVNFEKTTLFVQV